MFEIVERSTTSGIIEFIYSGYETETEAEAEAEAMSELDYLNDDDSSWYEVRRQRG